MAGFGGAAAAPKGKGKKAAKAVKLTLSPRRQWDTFKALVLGGSPRVKVYASLDSAEWTEVGEVAVAEPGTAQQAAQYNKRLILEHAARMKPKYALKAKELVAGVAGADGAPEKVVKNEMPSSLESGFEGAPDPTGMYKKAAAATFSSDPTAIIGSNFENKN